LLLEIVRKLVRGNSFSTIDPNPQWETPRGFGEK